jgi:hypothetical protein
MFVFEFVIALPLVGAVLSLWSARLGVPYPALLALTGVARPRIGLVAVLGGAAPGL